jgi:5'-nucleotidase
VPYLEENAIKGFHITRQGIRIYKDQLVKREDPRGRPYYWIGGDPPSGVNEVGTDFGDLAAGYVTITPIQLDMTAYSLMEELKSWQIAGDE